MAERTAAPSSQPSPLVVVDGPEPHSPLVNHLSAADKDAIRALRAHLPEIIGRAVGPTRATASIWGVTLDPRRPPSAREYIVLHKFLQAVKMDVLAAKQRLISTLLWREEADISSIMLEVFPAHLFGSLAAIFGRDKDGHPVTYSLYGNYLDPKAIFADSKLFFRWRVQFMERAIALLDFENLDQIVEVHDYTGVSDSFNTPGVQEVVSESKVLEAHYPMLVLRMYLVGMPFWAAWGSRLFQAIRPSHDFARTSTVVGSGASTIGKELSKVIDKSQLPEIYGGAGGALADVKVTESGSYDVDTKPRAG
ncbi:CRAL/TRIO domain-containing protein [Auricularia subglabra TFB-10046 SS5]|nr:CRAL/TRIO domain-containing protein [Auricularia subglabra TFB-10046 SS5]